MLGLNGGREKKANSHQRDKETFPTDESSVGSEQKSRRRQKITYGLRPMRFYWPAVDCLNPSKAGWSWGYVSAVDSRGRTVWIADAHRGDGKRFVVRADEKLSAFLELERAICVSLLTEQI